MTPERSRHAGVERLRDVMRREMIGAQDGPGGAANTVTPGPTPETPEVSVSLPRQVNPWTQEVRRAAFHAVRIAATRREASDRTLRYYVRAAVAHGLTVDEVCRAGRLDQATVLALTEPKAA